MAIKGLKAIKEAAQKSGGGNFDGESPFLSLKDGDSVKIRPLQEFDDESPNYDERRGTVLVVHEHSSPKDFKITGTCTAEEDGRCWACEQTSLPEIGKKWKPKMRFYMNVAVRQEDGTSKVKILKRGFSDKDIGNALIGMAEELENISGMDFKYTRKGAGMNDTSYTIFPLAPKPLTEADEALELIDPNKFIKHIPYEEQQAFYAGERTDDGGKADDWVS